MLTKLATDKSGYIRQLMTLSIGLHIFINYALFEIPALQVVLSFYP